MREVLSLLRRGRRARGLRTATATSPGRAGGGHRRDDDRPAPTWLLDLLITFNITLAVLILLVALYVQDAG